MSHDIKNDFHIVYIIQYLYQVHYNKNNNIIIMINNKGDF